MFITSAPPIALLSQIKQQTDEYPVVCKMKKTIYCIRRQFELYICCLKYGLKFLVGHMPKFRLLRILV